ncbi:MAG: hypothetical protein H6739_33300 [Alphaproteobacteria bacterium]|nr:hypothetical protein [Alphaproteobacteria bacterium]
MKRASCPLLFLLLLTGCGEDPALKAAREEAAAEAAEGPGVAGTPAGAPIPGEVGAPAPGVPDEPTPGDPNEPPPGQVQPQDGIRPPEGPTVAVKGEVTLPDYTAGPVRIDVFDGDHSNIGGGPRPGIVTRLEMDKPGPFELQIAEGTRVWLSAFNDENEDGRPSPIEPFGEYAGNPVDASSAVNGVTIVLERRDPPDQRGQ